MLDVTQIDFLCLWTLVVGSHVHASGNMRACGVNQISQELSSDVLMAIDRETQRQIGGACEAAVTQHPHSAEDIIPSQ